VFEKTDFICAIQLNKIDSAYVKHNSFEKPLISWFGNYG